MNHNLANLPDETLVKDYAAGNNGAFDALLKRHKGRVFSFILSVVRDRDVADDIFQETFIKAIMTIKQGRYVENGHFAAWLCRIAHNLVIDHFRQTKSENTVSSDDDEGIVLNRRDLSEGTIEDMLVNTQVHTDVRRIIAALPSEQKEVLEMRYYRYMSFKEIAETTGVSINTALGRMRYALLNMRKIVRDRNISLTLA